MTNPRNTISMKREASLRPRQEEYWTRWMDGFTGSVSFPIDHIRPVAATSFESVENFRLPDHLTARLSEMSRKSQVMVFVIFASVVSSLLYKYIDNANITIGSPVLKPEESGEFINTILPLRCQFNGESTFKEILLKMKQVIAEADANKDYPLELLMEESPLFDVAVMVDTIHDAEHIRHIPTSMTFTFSPNEKLTEIGGDISFDPLKYEPTTVSRIVEHLIKFLEKACFEPDAPLCGIDILGEEEKFRLIEEFNRTQADYPVDKTIHQLFEGMVEKYPDKIAVTGFPGDGEQRFASLSYRELNARANGLGKSLQLRGVGPEIIVGILMERSLELIVGILAVLKSGGAYLPIEKNYPQGRLRFIFSDSQASMLLTDGHVAASIDPGIEAINLNLTALQDRCDDEHPSSSVTASNLAYIIYTSGSTGTPKGVMIEHRNVVRLFINDKFPFEFSSSDVWTMFHSHCFDFSVWEIYGALLFGGKVVVVPVWWAKDVNVYWKLLLREHVTVLNQTPPSFQVLKDVDRANDMRLESLRYVILGGESFIPSKVKSWLAKYPDIKIVNMYGITETTVHVTYKDIGMDDVERGGSPIGAPLPTLSVYLMDRAMGLLHQGAIGEICVGGDGAARGYLNRPELTLDRFVTNPLKEGELLYRSGDLAKWSSHGELYYVGRADQQLKIRGFRIELGEIETQIIGLRGIKSAIVVPVENKQTDQSLCAYFVADSPVLEQDIVYQLREQLPEYMIPSYFHSIDKIPLTANGKVDRKALPEPTNTVGAAFTAPRNMLEAGLVDIWENLLGGRGKGEGAVSIDDNFFALGGHSLNAVALIGGIHKKFQVNIPLAIIFRYPTIRELGEVIARADKSRSTSIDREEDMDFYPVSPAQKRLYTLQKVEPHSAAYNISMGVAIEGSFDQSLLRQAVQSIVARHENLRTSFVVVGEEPVQKIHRQIEFTIEKYTMDIDKEYSFDSPDVEVAVRQFVRPFDLAAAPLLRVGLFEMGRQRYILCFDVHHIVFDGSSLEIFRGDLGRFYSRQEAPRCDYQYKDYVRWLQQDRTQEHIRKQQEYWLGEFDGPVPVLELFTDFPRPAVQSFEGRTMQFESPEGVMAPLKALSVRAGVSIHMVLFAVFNVFLNKISGQSDIVVGIPVKGRTRSELDSVIGLFVNTVAIRCRQNPRESFVEYLGQVKNKTLLAYENQDFQFDALVEQLDIRREMSRNPVFDVMFSMPNIAPQQEAEIFPGAMLQPYGITSVTSKFDLTLNAMETENRILFSFNYCTQLFRDGTIESFKDYFSQVLIQAVTHPDTQLETIALPATPVVQKQIRQTLPAVDIVNHYELAAVEGCVAVGCYPKEDGDARFPVFKPTGLVAVDIVDEQGRGLPAYIPGELVVRGVDDENRTVHSGDWARWLADGSFELLGKMDAREFRNGFWLDNQFVERKLLEYNGVEAVAIPKAPEGSAERSAFFVAGETIDPIELKEFLSKLVPQYMRPDRFVQVDEIPLTAEGIVDEGALLALASSSPEEASDNEDSGGNTIADALLQCWKEVLGVDHLTIHDDYFDLGGDSMKALKIITKLETQSMSLDITDLFFNPTIKQLQDYVRVDSAASQENSEE